MSVPARLNSVPRQHPYVMNGRRLGTDPDCGGVLTTNRREVQFHGVVWLIGCTSPCVIRVPLVNGELFLVVDDRHWREDLPNYYEEQGPFATLTAAVDVLIAAHVAKRLEGK